MDLKNKIVVITGSGRGFGKVMALAFQKEGAQVVLSSNEAEILAASAQELNCPSIIADVTKEEDVQRLAALAMEKFGRIDIWINNAGIRVPHSPIEEIDFAAMKKMVDINLFGLAYGSKAALVQMKKQGSGTIINIISKIIFNDYAGSAAYCASKYAAFGFTKILRVEAELAGIQVFSLYPGGMKTNLFDGDKPEDFGTYLEPTFVAEKLIANLKQENPEKELIVKRI
ncbi:MAG: SDR family oxidoreductase [bacterium]|nr:SDR family oxidoreductase [bacterium]